jgi:hypothetical protein
MSQTYRCPRCGGPAYLDVVNLKCDACRGAVGAIRIDEPEPSKEKKVTPAHSYASHYS